MRHIRANKTAIMAFFCGVSLVIGAVGVAQRTTAPPEVTAATAVELSSVFSQVTRQALPSVVSIESTSKPRKVQQEIQLPFDGENSPFGDLFKNDPRFRQFFENRTPRQLPPQHARGSGFIIDSAGVVMTNSHVVNGAAEVKIKLQDGRIFVATDIKTDPKSDVAIVRFEAPRGLPTLRMGDSSAMKIGDWVLAMGSPFGLDGTVTAGIISAKGRGPGIAGREDFLQTDAAINPGNSGGPLLNLKGEVIGINTAISTRSGGYDGIGFAVPIDMARWVAQQLIEDGSVERAFLGVTIQSVSNSLARQFGIEVGQGAIVTSVLAGSPAADAELEAGDVILKLDGQKVFSPRNLQGIVEKLTIGEEYQMVVLRNGERKTLSVVVREMPDNFAVAASKRTTGRDDAEGKADARSFDEIGMEVQDLTPQLAERLNAAGQSGVVVTSVESGSPAHEAGLRTGTIIQRVGRQNVSSVDEFSQAVEGESLEEGILLLVRHRGGGTGFVVVRE